jgi:hypothetical protein
MEREGEGEGEGKGERQKVRGRETESKSEKERERERERESESPFLPFLIYSSSQKVGWSSMHGSSFLCLQIQTLISFRKTLMTYPKIMFNYLAEHPVIQPSCHIKLTITVIY